MSKNWIETPIPYLVHAKKRGDFCSCGGNQDAADVVGLVGSASKLIREEPPDLTVRRFFFLDTLAVDSSVSEFNPDTAESFHFFYL
jgi:hypothetical protein